MTSKRNQQVTSKSYCKNALINLIHVAHLLLKKAAAYKLDSKCESLCEDALEILQEIVAADASLQKKKRYFNTKIISKSN